MKFLYLCTVVFVLLAGANLSSTTGDFSAHQSFSTSGGTSTQGCGTKGCGADKPLPKPTTV